MKTRMLISVTTISILIITLGFFLGCNTSSEPVKPGTNLTDEELILQLFETEIALKKTEDITQLSSIYSPSVIVFHGNNMADTGDDYLFLDGIGEVITLYQQFFDDYENIQQTIIISDIVINGKEATCNRIANGTHIISSTQEVVTWSGDTEPWKLKKINGSWLFISATWFAADRLTVEITGWVIDNIDKSYWTKWGYTDVWGTAFFNIWVEANDPDGIDDITYVEVSDPEGWYWVLRDSSTGIDLYDPEGGFFGGWRLWYSSSYPNAVYLGQYTALVRDSDGNEATDTQFFSRPGSTSGNGFVYSEDYKGITTGGIEMIKRANIISKTKEADDITIEFQVDDSRVFNGFIWFYDSSAEHITWSGYFKNTINGGAGLNVDGTTNTLVIQSSDLDLGSFIWGDISGFHVVLGDGIQYSPREDFIDHRSISSYEELF